MRANKNTSKIILAMIVALLATVVSYSAFNNMHNRMTEQAKLIEVMQKTMKKSSKGDYAYAVSKENLKAGEIVSNDDIDFQQFAVKNPNAFDERSEIINKILLQNISSGDVFTSSHIAKISNDNITLKENHRALTLPAESFQGKSDAMMPGSFVDIYNSSSDSNWVLENIRIISFESNKSKSSSKEKKAEPNIMNASAITFEVPVGSISDFISNISKKRLVLVVRGPNDTKLNYIKPKISSDNYGDINDLPSIPISNLSGLPDPINPMLPQESVEVIEANVKSKVTFD